MRRLAYLLCSTSVGILVVYTGWSCSARKEASAGEKKAVGQVQGPQRDFQELPESVALPPSSEQAPLTSNHIEADERFMDKFQVQESLRADLRVRLHEMRVERAQLMRAFHDLSPKQGLAASRQAVAAFSDRGLAVGDARVFIRRPGCVLEVRFKGRRYRQRLRGFDHCRLSEWGEQGAAQVWEVRERQWRGLAILDVKEDPNGVRCRSSIKTLRLSRSGPRISQESFTNTLCGYQGIDDVNYWLLPLKDKLMPLAKD